MMQLVRVSWVCALTTLALSAAFACGGGDDDDSAGRSGAGASGAGKGNAGSTPAGSGGGGGMKVFDAGSADDRNDVTAGELCQRVADILCAGEEFCCDD